MIIWFLSQFYCTVLFECLYCFSIFTAGFYFAFIWFFPFIIPCRFYASYWWVLTFTGSPLEGCSTGMGSVPGPGPASPGVPTRHFLRISYTNINKVFNLGSLPSISPLRLATLRSLLHTNVVATNRRPCIAITRPGFCKAGCLYPWLPTLLSVSLFSQNNTAKGFLLIVDILERLNTVIQKSLGLDVVKAVERWLRSSHEPRPSVGLGWGPQGMIRL